MQYHSIFSISSFSAFLSGLGFLSFTTLLPVWAKGLLVSVFGQLNGFIAHFHWFVGKSLTYLRSEFCFLGHERSFLLPTSVRLGVRGFDVSDSTETFTSKPHARTNFQSVGTHLLLHHRQGKEQAGKNKGITPPHHKQIPLIIVHQLWGLGFMGVKLAVGFEFR